MVSGTWSGAETKPARARMASRGGTACPRRRARALLARSLAGPPAPAERLEQRRRVAITIGDRARLLERCGEVRALRVEQREQADAAGFVALRRDLVNGLRGAGGVDALAK